MKYLLACLSLSLFSFVFKGSEIPSSEIPAKVATTFNENFTSAEDIEWKKTKHGDYEANFEILNIDYKAQISKSGHLTKYKHAIKLRSIPGGIASELTKNYSGYKVEKTEKIIVGASTYYQVELNASPSELHKVFTPTGKEALKIDYWN